MTEPPSDPRPDPERKYTLDEARQILAMQACQRQGHDLEVMTTASGLPVTVVCNRCPASWSITASS